LCSREAPIKNRSAISIVRSERESNTQKGKTKAFPKGIIVRFAFAMTKYKQLSSGQRYAIACLLQNGVPQKEIAKSIGVHPSTVSRELSRNGKKRRDGKIIYTHAHAQELAEERRECVVANGKKSEPLLREVERLLREKQWSPEQISGYLRKRGKFISHTCIYSYIHWDKKNGGDLYKCCRHKLKHRDKSLYKESRVSGIPDRVPISERPKEADGKRFGDWEMDTVIGKDGKGAILTLSERSTAYGISAKLPSGKEARACADKAIELLLPYKGHVLTITTDNGSEFADHRRICEALGTTVYFADPYSSWQKPLVENYNGLLRQYIPNGTDFAGVSEDDVHGYQLLLNDRPRKKLGYEKPKDVFFSKLHSQ